MADITEVKLPDASTFNIVDASALHPSDIVDNLATADATKPLSANMGHTLGDEVNAIVNVYGAKNICHRRSTFISGTDVANGIVISVNFKDDTFTASGSSAAAFDSRFSTYFYPPNTGNYHLNGCPSNSNGIYIYLFDTTTNTEVGRDTGSGINIPVDQTHRYWIGIYIPSGISISNYEFKPMFYDARLCNSEYAPYAKTNRELTRENTNLAPTENDNLAINNYAKGDYFVRDGQLCQAIAPIASGASFTQFTNYKETSISNELNRKPVSVTIDTTNITSGTIEVYRVGKIVEIIMKNVLFATTTPNQTVITGLPPVTFASGILSVNGVVKGVAYVSSSTLTAFPTDAGIGLYGTVVYTTAV